MNISGVSPYELPRSRAVTDALVDPHGPAVTEGDWQELSRALVESLRRNTTAGTGTNALRIDGYRLRSAAWTANRADPPFRWSPVTARRLIGVAALAAAVEGKHPSPASAVVAEEERLIADARSGYCRSGSLGDWLSRAELAARGAVRAAAVTWATRLFSALDWSRIGPGAVIGRPDEWWDCPGARGVCLRGRADVRVPLPEITGVRAGRRSYFSMLGGRPGPTSRAELVLGALVSGLRLPSGLPSGLPARVIGYWPDCGRTLIVPIERSALELTIDAVLHAARPAVVADPERAVA